MIYAYDDDNFICLAVCKGNRRISNVFKEKPDFPIVF